MSVSVEECLRLIEKLPEVQQHDHAEYVALKVRGRGFGFLWEATETIGLKATLEEQAALVGERPEVFEVQFTAGRFGWVVVHLAGIQADELEELITEAWLLSAPRKLAAAYGEEG